MKNTKNTLFKWLLAACVMLVAAPSAFAGMACGSAVYFTLPQGWKSAYIVAGGQKALMTPSGHGDWLMLSTDKIGGQNEAKGFFIEETGANDCNSGKCARKDSMNVQYLALGEQTGKLFTCDDFGTSGELWISAHPDATKEHVTYFSNAAPNAKYLYVMIPPDFEDWMSAVPMVSMDGGKTGKPLTADPDKCGWYSYMWLDEAISNEVVLYRDDDADREDMIGLNGNWETAATATPIPLGMLFSTYEKVNVNTLYFVPDENQLLAPTDDGWYETFPEGVEGTCSYTMAAVIYDTDASLHPAFSCYSQGGEGCQRGAQGVDATTAVAHVNACLGVQPGLVNKTLDTSVPQNQRKPTLSAEGKKCFMNDTYFNQLFNYTQGVNEVSCYDMPFKRSSDGKWEFDSDFYNYLDPYGDTGIPGPGGFYPVENTDNASVLAALPGQTPVPAARTKRGAEGPVFYGPAFRELDPVEQMPMLDIMCNGPGWNKGIDCGAYGMFNSGSNDEMLPAVEFVGGAANTCVMGWSCEKSAPSGWNFYKAGTDTVVEATETGATYRWTADRNQHYCFESHAQFTHKPGLRFNFRGDDDIWVFIDNQLAVDLGGTHLAAPGYVDLDYFTGLSGKLETGKVYNLDIFFCDRRTTMSNVRIKTNMYIQQRTAISVKTDKDKNDKSVSSIGICYTKSGDGSCASALSGSDESLECCSKNATGGNDFLTNPKCADFTMTYYLVQGTELNTEKAEPLTSGKVYYDGIDLTSAHTPKINKKKISLPSGRWTLFVVIDGNKKKVASFRQAGEVDVVSGDAVAVYIDDDDKEIGRTPYKFVKTAPAGGKGAPTSESELLPVYISAIAGTESDGRITMQPDDSKNLTYSLDIPNGLMVFKKDAAGKLNQITSATTNTIDATGVDTVYAFVPGSMLESASQTFDLKVSGRTTAASLLFYVPRLAFVDSLYKDAAGGWVFDNINVVKGDSTIDPSTGSIEERLTGMAYSFFIVALKPTEDGTGTEICSECNFVFSTAGSSNGVAALDSVMKIENGGAIIQVRSMKEYRVSENKPAKIIVVASSKVSAAQYSPIYFANPPCPIPAFADVFDLKGSVPAIPLSLPAPYFSMETEYQDGIADMVDVYYNRLVPADSVPLAICVEWETSSATKFYPAKEGVSTRDSEDDYVLCNAWIKQADMEVTNCDQTQLDADGNVVSDTIGGTAVPVKYCDQRVRLKDLTLSTAPKTAAPGKVISYSAYKDKQKNIIKQGFPSEVMIDRMAPIPVSAVVVSKKNGKGEYTGTDQLTLTMSEPVKIVAEDKMKVFDFYLPGSIGKIDSLDIYASATEETKYVITSQIAPAPDDLGQVVVLYKTKDADGNELVTPISGDFVRLAGNLSKVIWGDKSDINLGGADSIRAIVKANNATDFVFDETSYVWNAPTGYDESKDYRPTTPWVAITGSAQNGIYSNSFAYTGYMKDGATKSIEVNAYNKFKYTKMSDVVTEENGIPGWFVKADMLALYNLLKDEKKKELAQALDKIYFYYKVEVFTNLGNYVAGKSGKIYCDDRTNQAKYGKTFFGAKDENRNCLETGTNSNYYIGWNMLSDDGREVGTGAYISKVETYVKLGNKKDGELSETKVWGVKKGQKTFVPTSSSK